MVVNSELIDALKRAQSAVARLVVVLSKGDDPHATREAKVAERTLDWISVRLGAGEMGDASA